MQYKDNQQEPFDDGLVKMLIDHKFAKLYDEQRNQYRNRWQKPLLDSKTNKPTEFEGYKTFQELLTKRLKGIEEVLLPEIEKVGVSLNYEEKRRKYQDIWQKNAEKKFRETMLDIKKYGLEDYKELTDKEKDGLGRNYSIDLRGAKLIVKHFEGANCKRAYFSFAVCTNTHFECADLSSSHFECTRCYHTHFIDADCNDAHFEVAYFIGAHFDGAICIGAHFDGANFWDAHFDGANCKYAHFEGARCDEISFGVIETIDENKIIHRKPCDFTGVTYKNAEFLGVDTSNVDWSKNPGMKSYIEHQQFVQYVKDTARWWQKPLIFLWWLTSNCGKSFWQWLLSCVVIISGFTFLYWRLNFDFFHISKHIVNSPRLLSYLYFSVVTFSTLGFGDVTPIVPLSMICVMAEVILGYIMLGGLITFFVKWLGRR